MSQHHHFSPDEWEKLNPEQKREAEGILEALDDLRTQDPLQFFNPHAKQHDLLMSAEPVKAFLGGNRSGKTTIGIVDDLIQAIDPAAVPVHLKQYKRWAPPFYCRIATPDFTSTMEGVIYQKLREWAPRAQLVGDSWSKAYDKQNRVLRFKNGSWFQFMTYEQDLDKFGGAALHRIHYDEEPPESIRKECLMRLIDYAGEELFTMTPLMGMTWMYGDIWEPWEKGELEDGFVVTVDMDDNPYLDEVTKRRVLRGLSEEERKARKEGRFVHFGGLIYPSFSRDDHCVPDTRPPEGDEESPWGDCDVYVGIDPGQRHMAAVVYCAVDHAGKITVFDEIAIKGGIVADVATAIHMKNAQWGITPRLYVIDPAAQNRLHQTGRSDQMEYADKGIVTAPGQNSVTAGINNVRTRLQFGGLEISFRCTTLIDEFRKYRWASPKKAGEEDPKEAPIKKDDHLLDALRYVCMARPFAPKESVPVVVEPLHVRLARDQYQRDRRSKPNVAQGGPGRYL